MPDGRDLTVLERAIALAILEEKGHHRPLDEQFPNVRNPVIRQAQLVAKKLVELEFVSEKGLTVGGQKREPAAS